MQFTDLKAQYAALKPRIDARIQQVLDHGQYILGPEVKELEEALTRFTGSRHCITVASGTEALLIALMALDLKAGEEVITTPFTFAATAEMIVLAGGRPVFVDIEPDTCNIDASRIEAQVTPRTRAIMPVSLYGQVADMDEINAVAARHGLAVIEDAAQSFGAVYKGQRSCVLSTFGATSFFPSKPLGCYGDGGALFTDDDKLAQAAREIRVHGQSGRYVHTRLGVGGRLDTLQAAVLLAKLERFEWELERRAAIGARYERLLAGLAGVQRIAVRGDRNSVYAQYTVKVDDRAAVQAALQAAGVPSAVHYPKPLHRQPAYAQYAGSDPCTVSDREAARVLSLPMSADLSEADQDRVVQALAAAVRTVAAAAVGAATRAPSTAVTH
ncbi:MAG: DegT/DnrJ/EryC1/StrS family aminotransferase [Burkholderiales bacterium]|nr:DegT/DnrJ/EryC1/StrS family aminotransferase [Burkholderiales bacterium]